MRFDQIERMSYKYNSNSQYGYRVYSANTSILFKYGFRDYSLALLRILQELPKRTIQIDRVPPHDPRWEEKVNAERKRIFDEMRIRHQRYFEERSDQLEKLKQLATMPLAPSLAS